MTYEFGKLGNENRKFLSTIYKPALTEVFMKIRSMSPSVLPLKYDMRNIFGNVEIYNQGSLGSCTANAIAYAYKIMSLIRFRKAISICRLFVYYNERVIIGKVFEDSGAFIKDGFISMQTQGACLEKFWPYIEQRFTVMPSLMCYNEARLHRTRGYNAQLDPRDMVNAIKQCLVLNLPVVIGVMVYESFVSDLVARTGFIPVPNVQSERFVGGHALATLGFDDDKQHFIVINSWSEVWGDRGMCYIPYQFIANNDLYNDCHAFLDVELKLLVDDETSPEEIFDCLSPKNMRNCELI